jgi:hypothetical protein
MDANVGSAYGESSPMVIAKEADEINKRIILSYLK